MEVCKVLKTFDRNNKRIERRIIEKGTREENMMGRKNGRRKQWEYVITN
jgi:hypothetical protein